MKDLFSALKAGETITLEIEPPVGFRDELTVDTVTLLPFSSGYLAQAYKNLEEVEPLRRVIPAADMRTEKSLLAVKRGFTPPPIPTPATFVKLLKNASYGRNLYDTFSDFLTMAAGMVASTSNLEQREALDKVTETTRNRYNDKEKAYLNQALSDLIYVFRQGAPFPDFLGEVLMAEELSNKRSGQFFTPMHVSTLCAQMNFADLQDTDEQGRIITMAEPAAGAGGMVLACLNVLEKKGFPYGHRLCVTATDIDVKCFRMTFLQLALAGVPAIVVHGNALSMEVWATLVTPAYVFNRVGPRLEAQCNLERCFDLCKNNPSEK